MVYVTSDGKVLVRQPFWSNPIGYVYTSLSDAFFGLTGTGKAVVIVCLAVALHLWEQATHPLAFGSIPATKVAPQEQWNAIAKDTMLIRAMSDYLSTRAGNTNHEDAWNVIFGGPDGHVLEGDWGSAEGVRGTRCSSTRSALTAYFCGAKVARNQDHALGTQRKPHHKGLQSFADVISCRHSQGERNNGNHRRSIYRIGIGCEDVFAGYSHAFTIVAQPDGSFFWLQSFISRYSLTKWMEQVDSSSGLPRGQMSLAKLQSKLQQIDRLMNIYGWTDQANADYHELFWVDMEKEALEKNNPPVSSTWQMSHRLDHFYWDEACEYPLLFSLQKAANNTDYGANAENNYTNDNDHSHDTHVDKNETTSSEDECLVLLNSSVVEELINKLEVVESSTDSQSDKENP